MIQRNKFELENNIKQKFMMSEVSQVV